MLNGVRPYSEYRSSGLVGLGDIPAQWELMRAKVFLREIDEKSVTGDEELLSVSHKTGVTPRSEKTVTMFLAESNAGYKRCERGDVVINTMWAWMAALGVSERPGIVSPSYGVYRPLQPDAFLGSYLDELLRTQAYRDEYVIRSSGITDSRLRLYPDDFLTIPLLHPPHEDQLAIIRYMRHADRAIRRYIVAKRKTLALFAELREAATQSALRSDGTRSRRLGLVADKIVRPVDRSDDETYVPIGLYNRGRGIFHKTPTKGADLGDSSFFWLADGDLVFSGQFAWEGAIALAGPSENSCVASHRYPILRGKPGELDSAYLLAFFRTPWGQVLLNHHSRGAAGRNRPLNAVSLMKEAVPVPPLSEQEHVVALVHAEARLRRTITALEAFLLEYRARLIADVVTGKLDVREAVAGLPDEVGTEEMAPDELDLFSEEELEEDEETLQDTLEEVEV